MPSGENELLEDLLNVFGENLVSKLADSIKKNKHRAGGGLEDSIKFTVTNLGNKYSFKLFIADYYTWLDSGRGATSKGSKPGKLRDLIRKWILKKQGEGFVLKRFQRETKSDRKKRIRGGKSKSIFEKELDTAAFLITRKIHEKGFKPSHFYSSVVTDKLISDLRKEVGKTVKQDILIELKKEK